ncbi:MAG: response regulator [Candidatus Rokuibacteriota bacterium]
MRKTRAAQLGGASDRPGLAAEASAFSLTRSEPDETMSPYGELSATAQSDGKALRQARVSGPAGTVGANDAEAELMELSDRRVRGVAEILTIRDVAAYLKLPVSTVYRLAERRELPGHKVGRQWRFHKPILDDWFRQHAARARVSLLVVDDEEAIRQFLVTGLQSPQRQILTAGSGEEAIEIVKQTPIDLVTLDVVMPGMNGVETFRQLHALRPELPVVMVTGYPDSNLIVRALEIGPFTVINKPVDLNHIQKVVDVIVGA